VKKPPKPIGKATPKLPINQPQTPQAKVQTQTHRRLWQAAKAAGIFVAGVIALLSGIYQLGGSAPWPTDPVFFPGQPSFVAAFEVPFVVENKSAFFWIKNLKITCVIPKAFARSPLGSAIGFENMEAEAIGLPGSLAPTLSSRAATGMYACPLRRLGNIDGRDAVEQMVSAEISFRTEYDGRWWWQKPRIVSEDGPFTLVTTTMPHRWMRGRPLN
jgi:hypothetical protein